jgi:hypothetical protein
MNPGLYLHESTMEKGEQADRVVQTGGQMLVLI